MYFRCHLGNIIEYDTVSNLSWSVDVRTHAIAQMIEKVLWRWAAAMELGREVAPLKRQDDCVVGPKRASKPDIAHPVAGLLEVGLWKLLPVINNFEIDLRMCPLDASL
jgi:hypothetical protein